MIWGAFTSPATLRWSNWLSVSGTCYVWRMMRGGSLTTHFEPLHKLRAHAGDVSAAFVYPIYRYTILLPSTSSLSIRAAWRHEAVLRTMHLIV